MDGYDGCAVIVSSLTHFFLSLHSLMDSIHHCLIIPACIFLGLMVVVNDWSHACD